MKTYCKNMAIIYTHKPLILWKVCYLNYFRNNFENILILIALECLSHDIMRGGTWQSFLHQYWIPLIGPGVFCLKEDWKQQSVASPVILT